MNEDRSSRGEAALSVVITGRDGLASLGPILLCLSEQTAAQRIELLAVLPQDEPAPPEAEAFAAWRTVVVGPIGNRGRAAAHGVRAASAPIVAFTENHCFPEPDWAEKLIAAHDGEVAGVAPAILNANPETELAWAMYTGGYARFSADVPPGDIDEMPLHNTSYRRDLLLAYDNELDDLLAHETRLMSRLRERGGRFILRPDIRAHHVNEATWDLALGLNFCNGRRYGGRRALSWSWPRRVAYAFSFPALSFPIAADAWRQFRSCRGRPPLVGRAGVFLWMTALAHASGEAMGYLLGPKDTFEFVDRDEFMILERLGGSKLSNRTIARFVDRAVPLSS